MKMRMKKAIATALILSMLLTLHPAITLASESMEVDPDWITRELREDFQLEFSEELRKDPELAFSKELETPDRPYFDGREDNQTFEDLIVSEGVETGMEQVKTTATHLVTSFEGDGSKSNPYKISNTEHLFELAQSVNSEMGNSYSGSFFVLTSDINFDPDSSWIPIGWGSTNSFEGIFDGAGYCIKGFNMTDAEAKFVGLFGFLRGTVKNVVIEDSHFEGEQYVGTIAGYAAPNSSIINCRNYGSVVGDLYVGGIVGRASRSRILDCENYGSVFSRLRAGGIVGYLYLDDVIVAGCENYGDVSSKEYWAGGIVGQAFETELSIMNCKNYGEIFSGRQMAGGIIGEAFFTSIADCENYGKINTLERYSGGITGYSTKGDIVNCVNYGEINSNYQINSDHICAGGIAGYVQQSNIRNCINTAPVTGDTCVGGVVGGGERRAEISSCANYGLVEAASYAGGIAGLCDGLIIDSFNTAGVKGDFSAGGIVGIDSIFWQPLPLVINNCYSRGVSVTGNGAGGLIGSTNDTSVISSYYLYSSATIGIGDGDVNQDRSYARTASQLKLQSTFEGWDFENIWEIEEEYPFLQGVPKLEPWSPVDMLLWPAESSQVTLWFGQNNLLDPAIHMGMNIQGEPGDDIYAVHDGTVVYTGYNPRYGHMLFINFTSDGKEMQARYGFLSAAPRLSVGANVQKGQTIGTMALHEDTGKGHMEIVLLESNDGNVCEVSGINAVIVDPNIYMERPEISDIERFEYLGQPMAAVLDESGLSTFVTFASNAVSLDDGAHRYRMNLDLEIEEFDWGDEYDNYTEESFSIELYSEIGQYQNIVKSYENYIRKLIWDKVKHQHKGSTQKDLEKLGYLSYDKSTDTCTVKLNGRTHKYGPSLGNAVYKNKQMVVNTETFWNNHYRKTYTSSTGGTWTPKNAYFTKSNQKLVCEIYLPKDVAMVIYTVSNEPTNVVIIGDLVISSGTGKAVEFLTSTLGVTIPAKVGAFVVGYILLVGNLIQVNEQKSFYDAVTGCGDNQFVKISVYQKTVRDLQKIESRSYSIADSITDRYPQNGSFKAGVYEGLEILEQL